MATGRMVGDRLTGKMGYKGILVFDSLLIAGGLGLAIGIQTPLTVILGFGMVGFGVATIIPIVYSLAGRSKTMPASSALAAVSTLGFTGFLVGPPVIGFAAHEVGLRWALTILMGMALLVLFLSRKLRT
jgi:MFS family permease